MEKGIGEMGKIYYLHLLNGEPAYYEEGEQICYANFYRRAVPLAASLHQIRREQKLSTNWKEKMGLGGDGLVYSHLRVEVPD